MSALSESLKDMRKRYKIRREKPQFWFFIEQRFGYIQIPKVATRSIRKALLTTTGEKEDERPFTEFEKQYSAHVPHAHIRHLVDSGLFVFAFVRDPLARLHSAWVNKIVDAERHGRRNIFRCHGIHYGMSFSDFVQRVCQLEDHQLDRHIRSQSWFLTDRFGILPSYVGQLERFAQCWDELCARIPTLGHVAHINKGAHGMDYLAAYDDKTLSLAVRRYEKDFRLFGYQQP